MNSAEFRFTPLSSSWVAIHPQPKGVVQFIGGAFFGTFPTLCYRYLLKQIFEAGYTVIAFPFRFSFRHWLIAVDLLKEQDKLRQEISEIACHRSYDDIYQDKTNYFWVGHSLGCKYIALLEFLSSSQWQQILLTCTDASQVEQVEQAIVDLSPESLSIKGQPSLLLAPDIADTESAIQIHVLAQLLDRLKLGALPTRSQTQCLIQGSELFNLTALISFDQDTVAGSVLNPGHLPAAKNDVLWMIQQLQHRAYPLLHEELPGKHLEPLGVQIEQSVVDLNPFDKFVEPIRQRSLEHQVIQFLAQLRRREQHLKT